MLFRLAYLLVLALFFQAPPVTPEQRKEAGAAFQKGEWAKAGAIYAKIADTEPSNAAAWHRLGYCRYQTKEYEPALAAFEHASDVGQNADSMYSAGCMCALLKRPDPAFEWIDKALEAGFSDEATFLADEDLASVRADPRYAAAKVKVHANARPCSVDPKARQFDFWIGEWDVQSTATRAVVGKSSIQLILGDCVIFENWANLKGGTGKSFNVYNRDKGFWQQTWIDDHGEVTEYVNGVLENGAMQFVAGPEKTFAGDRLRRMTFYDQGPKQVRQLIETSTDGGKTWAAQYDLTYVRKPDVATK